MTLSRGDRRANPLKGALAGLLAGAAASAPMDLYWWAAQGVPGARPEQKPRPNSGLRRYEPATQFIADKVSEMLTGHDVRAGKKSEAGVVAHYLFGAGSGAIYGLLAALLPRARGGAGGVAFGLFIWAGVDEWLLRAIGASPDADKVPMDQHIKAAGAHVVWGGALGLLTKKLL